MRQPLKGKSDTDKIGTMTVGWHEDSNGKWYQNADGTYYAGGFQDIDGQTYAFDSNGYLQTGWVTKGVNDYFFKDDGTYDPSQKRPMLALTFDDGPGQYTEELLDCLEENNAHATFFMLGNNVSEYPDAPKRMLELGCEIGSHSWDHTQLTTIDLDAVAKQFSDTDDALIQACGQAASVARAPYGDGNSDIYNTVNKPFFMWSLDTEDWKLMDADADYSAVMNGDLTDGSIILMHDIHEPSVKAALRLIPDLIAKGYKLVTVSEMAEAKSVTLQNACYVDFWQELLWTADRFRDIRAVLMQQLLQTEQMVHLMQVQTLLTEVRIILMEVQIPEMEAQMTAAMMTEATMMVAMTMEAMMIPEITVMIM